MSSAWISLVDYGANWCKSGDIHLKTFELQLKLSLTSAVVQ